MAVPDIWHAVITDDKEPASKKNQRILKRKGLFDSTDLDFDTAGQAELLRLVRASVAEGAYAKGAKLLLSEGIHDSTDPVVLQKLRALHPSAPVATVPQAHLTLAGPLAKSAYEAEQDSQLDNLRTAVQSFAPRSSAGPSGLRTTHIQEILTEADSDGTPTLLKALRVWVAAAITGSLHPLVVSTICAARLFPLKID